MLIASAAQNGNNNGAGMISQRLHNDRPGRVQGPEAPRTSRLLSQLVWTIFEETTRFVRGSLREREVLQNSRIAFL